MKKILTLLIILVFSMQICLAQNDSADSTENIDSYFNEEPEQPQTQDIHGYLEYNQDAKQLEQEEEAIQLNKAEIKGVNISKPKSFSSKSLLSNYKKPILQPIQDELTPASKFSSQEYNIKPVKTTYSKKIGKFSFGTMYDSSLDSAQVNYSTGLFTKYEGKYFGLSTAFSKHTNSNYDSYDDKFFIVPELKLTKELSLLDVMQTDVNQINKKNEFVLRYTPHFKKYADDVQFELGAGQSFYQNNYIKSSLSFSTRFKL